jgi:outer membrane receptor protein involved in Fe transport
MQADPGGQPLCAVQHRRRPAAGSLAAATYSNVGLFDLSKGEQWEVGSKFDFLDGRGAATVAVYQIVRKDFAVAIEQRQPDGAGWPADLAGDRAVRAVAGDAETVGRRPTMPTSMRV